MRYDQLREILAIETSGDVLLEPRNIDWKIERQAKGRKGIIGGRRRTPLCGLGEHQTQLHEINGLDDIQLSLIWQDSSDL